MTLALVTRHLRQQAVIVVTLAVALLGFEVLIIRIGASFELGGGMDSILELMPGFIQELVRSQIRDLSFPAIVALGFAHPAVFVALIGHVVLSATLITVDRERGTLDLLVARPVPRHQHVLAALACIVLGAALFPACMLAGNALGLAIEEAPDELPWTSYVPCAVGLAVLLLALGGLTLWMAVTTRRRGAVVARVLGLLVALYLLEFLAELWKPLRAVRWISPFHYYKPILFVTGPGEPLADAAVLSAIFVVTTLGAIWSFERQDL